MLVKEGEESEKTKDSPNSQGIPDFVSEEIKIPLSEDKREGGGGAVPSPPRGKRAASEDWEEQAPKRGKMPLEGGSDLEGVRAQYRDEDKSPAK